MDITNYSALGLLISLSVIFAAGIAVYENPQVRQWVDSSRRKIAIALHSLGDEITPPSPSRASSDASTREDQSPEAVERRRKARQEILERARASQEKRKSKNEVSEQFKTFDDLVDKNGVLKTEKDEASTTAAEKQPEFDQEIRKRHRETTAIALGSVVANPFVDEMHTPLHPEHEKDIPSTNTRSSTPTLAASPTCEHSALPPRPSLTTDVEETSNHPSEALVDLTPTTSVSSTAHADLSELSMPAPSTQNHWSVHEWAESAAPSFYTPPQSEAIGLEHGDREGVATPATGDHLSHVGGDAYTDFWSDVGDRISTPGSWTEVGSVVSEDY